jgi:hypothetical protein
MPPAAGKSRRYRGLVFPCRSQLVQAKTEQGFEEVHYNA